VTRPALRNIVAAGVAARAVWFASIAGAQTLVPEPKTEAERPTPAGEILFVADPVTDGAILSISLGFAALLDMIIGTRELKPQVPGDDNDLLSFDRAVIDDEPSAGWKAVSNVGLGLAGAYAVGDSIYTAAAVGSEAGFVDFIIYGESAAITWALTDLAKLAVRRPRPSAYQRREELEASQDPSRADDPDEYSGTNAALSFFSGHASITAALCSTATYLAFAREHTATRGIVTAGGGLVLTTAVAVGRVKGGQHFPTDVIAGAMAGTGVGALVPHLHRAQESKPVWVGVGPQSDGGLGLSVNGLW